jgi:hypothetical protein
MEVSNEALRLKTDWNALGRGEVEGEEVAYFSPRWSVRRIANTARNVRPMHLVSVGLTNEPNIRPPHSPAPVPVLTVSGAAGAKANS